MKRSITVFVAAGLLMPLLGADAMAQASAPLPSAAPVSPAVQAAESVRPEPGGATPPEAKAVPQVSIPLRGAAADGTVAAPPGGVDDDAARCSAMKTKKARADCHRRTAAPPKGPGSL